MKTSHYKEGKARIRVIPKKGNLMDTCATFSTEYLCCRVHVLKSVQNCPYDCSYCFLQSYLTDGTTKTVADIDMLMREVNDKISAEPQRMFRIGTWELGDSLALEHKTGQAAALVDYFSKLDNAVLELKTKSANVDPLLPLDHRGKTVVSWSLNTDEVINSEEHRTAPLEERISAISKTAEAGYLTGLHFDPMILHDNWQNGYKSLVR